MRGEREELEALRERLEKEGGEVGDVFDGEIDFSDGKLLIASKFLEHYTRYRDSINETLLHLQVVFKSKMIDAPGPHRDAGGRRRGVGGAPKGV